MFIQETMRFILVFCSTFELLQEVCCQVKQVRLSFYLCSLINVIIRVSSENLD